MLSRFRNPVYYFYFARILCAAFGLLTFLTNSQAYFSTSIIPKFILSFLILAGLIPLLLIIWGKNTVNWKEQKYFVLIKNRNVTFVLLFSLFVTIAILFSAPEGIKATYHPLYLRFEPLLIYVLSISIVLIITKIYLRFKETGNTSIREFCGFLFTTYCIPVIIFIFPFFFYFPRTLPINAVFSGIGNDFIPITYSHKVYLLDYLSKFQIPLWSPGEGAGFPFYSSPHTQTFYPLNILLAYMYKINGGYSILDHQRFTILGIMIFALGLFFWLRQFKFDIRTVIALSLIIPSTYKIAELQRYSLATHSVAWYPWLLYSITLLFSKNRSQDLWKPSIIFFFSLVCILTAGYPYYVYYLVFLFIPILVYILFFHKKESVFKNPIIVTPINFVFLCASGISALMLSGPYLLKMIQLMNQTSGRSGVTLDFAAGHPFTSMDTLGSLIFPPSAQAEGWYYFGILLIVLVCWFILKVLFNKEARISFNPIFIFVTLISIFLISWITYGVDSPLFIFLWKYIPFFSSLRTWGRLSIIIIILLTPLLGFAIEAFIQHVHACENDRRKSIATILIISGICFSIICTQLYLNTNRLYDPYWMQFFFYLSGSEWSYSLKTVLVYILLSSLIIASLKNIRISQPFFLSVLVLFSLIDLWPVSSTMWKGTEFNVVDDKRKILNISQTIIPESLKYHRTDTMMAADIALTPKYFVGYADDWYFARYKNFFTSHSYEVSDRSELLGITDLKRLYLTTKIDYKNISDFLQDSKIFPGNLTMEKYTGDSIKINIEASKEGFISFIDNWDPDWIAYVNDKPVKVDMLFGTFKSVPIPKGNSVVIFQYSPSLTSSLPASVWH